VPATAHSNVSVTEAQAKGHSKGVSHYGGKLQDCQALATGFNQVGAASTLRVVTYSIGSNDDCRGGK
jgi:hypothetical protein